MVYLKDRFGGRVLVRRRLYLPVTSVFVGVVCVRVCVCWCREGACGVDECSRVCRPCL